MAIDLTSDAGNGLSNPNCNAAQRWNTALAFVLTLLEAVAALLLLRLVWRLLGSGLARLRRAGPVRPAEAG